MRANWCSTGPRTTPTRPNGYGLYNVAGKRDWSLKVIGGKPVDLEPLHDVEVDLRSLVRTQTGETLQRLEGKIQAALAGDVFTKGRTGAAVPAGADRADLLHR
ncbi:hypothetical protein [Streptomyces sp. NBC_00455]|uniref:hypothetical protein n=1 Tax=Streptomyces sp. NBC_00455 TaxID=2903654 RepID=UPI002E2342FE